MAIQSYARWLTIQTNPPHNLEHLAARAKGELIN